MSIETGSSLVTEWRELLARKKRVSEALEKELGRKHDLSVIEFEVLQRLTEHPDDGCRLQLLLEDLPVSQSALSRLIARLEDDGLVERRNCSSDRRGIFAALTDEGRQRLHEAEPTQLAVLEKTLR